MNQLPIKQGADLDEAIEAVKKAVLMLPPEPERCRYYGVCHYADECSQAGECVRR